MKTFQFKKLELKQDKNRINQILNSAHFKKTLLYSTLGAVAGYALFYFGQGSGANSFWNTDALLNVLMGFGFGIFLTNSPCAGGKC